jgi:RNA polymerase sigma-70 factor (ECF subfamily)
VEFYCKEGMDDSEVIKVYLKNQSEQCFSMLYNRYVKKVYAKCVSILKEESLARDATQEIFLKIFLNLIRFEEKARFSTWVYAITYNYCIDYLRRSKKASELFADDFHKVAEIQEEVSDEVILNMEIGQLKKVLDALVLGDKLILLMKYQDDLSIKEISQIVSKSESAVKMQLKRAKAKAQKYRLQFEEKEKKMS